MPSNLLVAKPDLLFKGCQVLFKTVLRKNKDYILHIYSNNKDSFSLKAPRCGSMNKEIYESINSNIYVCLSQNNNVLFEGNSKNCGLEIVL